MNIMDIVRNYLLGNGACKGGFADISKLPLEGRYSMKSAVSIVVALNPRIVSEIISGPTIDYYKEYERVNNLLEQLGHGALKVLKEHGYEAISLAVTEVGIDERDLSTKFPHKTAAVLSGIGWIGKSALLVTKDYGSAIRLTTVLTDIDIKEALPICKSLCGSCTECVKACPGGAIKGFNWKVGTSRDSIYDAFVCRKTALEQAEKIGIRNTICGICISICPWTKKFIEKSKEKEQC